MKVLVVDIGGSSIKIALCEDGPTVRVDSTPDLGPHDLVRHISTHAGGWKYDAVSIGYPGKVNAQGPAAEPGNLGSGWVSFDFERALGRPVRVVNDAIMQALGAYDGGRMLFFGLGTGIGSAIVTERVAVPLELGVLPLESATLFDILGRDGLEREPDRWQRTVFAIVPVLQEATLADYVVLGGGNAARVERLPPNARRGGNDDAMAGGFRLWKETIEPHDRKPSPFWRVVE